MQAAVKNRFILNGLIRGSGRVSGGKQQEVHGGKTALFFRAHYTIPSVWPAIALRSVKYPCPSFNVELRILILKLD